MALPHRGALTIKLGGYIKKKDFLEI